MTDHVPPSRPAPSHAQTKDVPLPHVPPKPVEEPKAAEQSNVSDNTKAEQAAGKEAVANANKRLEAEQAAGSKAIGKNPK